MAQKDVGPTMPKSLLQQLLNGLCAVGSVLVVVWLVGYGAYGIDFTDESFYLIWISDPYHYPGSVTQFGFIYHPLYLLLDGDVVRFRIVNFFTTYILAWLLSFLVLARFDTIHKPGWITCLILSAGLSCSVFTIFDSWIITPSYNTLALKALIVTVIGLLICDRESKLQNTLGCILIGTGGWLAFMAKPTTALALAISILLYVIWSRRLSIRELFLSASVATSLTIAGAFAIDGSVFGFIQRLKLGLELSNLLQGGHTIGQMLRLDSFNMNDDTERFFAVLVLIILIALWSFQSKRSTAQSAGVFICLFLFAATVAMATDQVRQVADFGQFQGMLLFSLVCAVIFFHLLCHRMQAFAEITREQWAIIALFLALPHIYAFGTNGNYWRNGTSAGIFWLLAGTVIFAPALRGRNPWPFISVLALATQSISILLLQAGAEKPYRQSAPIWENRSPVAYGSANTPIFLSDDFASYVKVVRDIAQGSEFQKGTPLLDLSGQSPGIVFALNAEGLGHAWTIGGYKGSQKFVEAGLALAPCEKIARAWVLQETGGPRSLSIDLLSSFGAKFPDDYLEVGTWQTAPGAGGFASTRTQSLWRPMNPISTLQACNKLRTR
ncbi:hypothetical protein [Roseobacter sp. S98]|uniref:hypothetical protein n=1 Tax=Roseobacter algicola (ex Choi et al. 2025) (nom. illeg.) TaxID=3092138 RepID=UPI003F51887B